MTAAGGRARRVLSVVGQFVVRHPLALTFIALLVPVLQDRPAILAALAAGTVAVLARGWPYNLGLSAAVIAGIGAGLLAEHWQRPPHVAAHPTPRRHL